MNWFSGHLLIWLLRPDETSAQASWRDPDKAHCDVDLIDAQAIVDKVTATGQRVHTRYEPHPIEVYPSR